MTNSLDFSLFLNYNILGLRITIYGAKWPFMCWCAVKKLLT